MIPRSIIVVGGAICLSGLPATGQVAAFSGTLSNYLALDDSGVTIGDAVFSDFKVLPLQQGASGFGTQFINVIPLTNASAPGFRFELQDGATAEDFFELRFSFRVSKISVGQANLALGMVNITTGSNAGVDVVTNLRKSETAPGSFADLISFAVEGLSELQSSGSFTPITDFMVEFDAVIDGGGVGRPGEIAASVGSASLTFGRFEGSDLRITSSGLKDPNTFFIEFVSTPLTGHVVMMSPDLEDGFPQTVTLSQGSGTSAADGTARVEFDKSPFGPAAFFRVETTP